MKQTINSTDVIDAMISTNLRNIVHKEVEKYRLYPELQAADLVAIEKLAKIYSILMADHRENLKSGIYDDKSDEELQSIAGGSIID